MKQPNISDINLSTSAVLCDVTFNQWGDTRKDKQAGEELAHMKNASADVVSLKVSLLGNCQELSAIKKFTGNARNALRHLSLPWDDNGRRLVPTAQYATFHKRATELHHEYNELVEAFIDVYDYERMGMQAQLGDLFRPDQYPEKDYVRSRFGMHIQYAPVPSAGDFRVDLGNDANEAMKQQYQAYYETAIAKAQNNIWERTLPLLQRISTQLHDEDGKRKRIYDSLIGNVEDLIEFMTACNITNDPEVTRVQTEIAKALRGVTVEQLKHSAVLRSSTKQKVDDILDNLPTLDL